MRSGASGAEVLAARDARQALLDGQRGVAPALVALSLAVPGSDKVPPGAAALFGWALERARATLPGARPLHLGDDALGPFALLAVAGTPAAAKAACLAIEAARPAARLVDLDVHGPGGEPLDRAALGLPPRPCLLCGEPAKDCARTRRHDPAAVAARAHALLADPAA